MYYKIKIASGDREEFSGDVDGRWPGGEYHYEKPFSGFYVRPVRKRPDESVYISDSAGGSDCKPVCKNSVFVAGGAGSADLDLFPDVFKKYFQAVRRK